MNPGGTGTTSALATMLTSRPASRGSLYRHSHSMKPGFTSVMALTINSTKPP
jgi:hypothetical protein